MFEKLRARFAVPDQSPQLLAVEPAGETEDDPVDLESRTGMRATVVGAEVVTDSMLEVEIHAYVQDVNFTDFPPAVTATVGPDDRVCGVIPSADVAVVESPDGSMRRYVDSGWIVIVDGLDAPGEQPFDITLKLRAGPFTDSRRVRFDPARIKIM